MVNATAHNAPSNLILTRLSATLFFIAVFLYFYHPVDHGDVWIHLNGGKWIWENGGFPASDPFVFTEKPENAERLKLINRGYWLTQITFYNIYQYTGFTGLNIFHATLFTLIFILLWKILLLQGVDPLIGLVAIIPCVLIGIHYNELRPRNFTYLFLLMTYGVLEKILSEIKENDSGRNVTKSFYLLPVIVVIWANLYRGFIIIAAILGAYLAGELLVHRFRKRIPRINLLFLWMLLAFFSSLFNPNFIASFSLGLGEISQSYDQFPIIELIRPWEYPALTGGKAYFYYVVLVYAVTTTILVMSWRRIEFRHIFLFCIFAFTGMIAFRFTLHFVLTGVAIAGQYARIPKKYFTLLRLTAIVSVALFVTLLSINSNANFDKQNQFFQDSTALPIKAMDYVIKNKPPQPIFNPYNWGGYISWRTFPEYKVFNDSRFFDPAIYAEEVNAERQRTIIALLDKYKINTAIYFPLDAGEVKWIVLDLLKSVNWGLVYFDNTTVIFVRNNNAAYLPFIDKQRVYDFMMLYAQIQIRDNPLGRDGYANLSDIYRAMGRNKEADEIYTLGLTIARPGIN